MLTAVPCVKCAHLHELLRLQWQKAIQAAFSWDACILLTVIHHARVFYFLDRINARRAYACSSRFLLVRDIVSQRLTMQIKRTVRCPGLWFLEGRSGPRICQERFDKHISNSPLCLQHSCAQNWCMPALSSYLDVHTDRGFTAPNILVQSSSQEFPYHQGVGTSISKRMRAFLPSYPNYLWNFPSGINLQAVVKIPFAEVISLRRVATSLLQWHRMRLGAIQIATTGMWVHAPYLTIVKTTTFRSWFSSISER